MSTARCFASIATALLTLSLVACDTDRSGGRVEQVSPDEVAEAYVRLVLAVGEHDASYVDAYFGPGEWRAEVKEEAASLEELRKRAAELIVQADALQALGSDPLLPLRNRYLRTQLAAVETRIAMLQGEQLSFDEETRRLYGAVAHNRDAAYYQAILDRIDAVVPGEGELADRVEAFRQRFVIPRDRLDAVFTAAIEACRERTLPHVGLPEGESFTVEYVNDKPWSGYNWYKGGSYSLIQVNTDLPIFIDRAVDLGCHEGYPGHHTYNALLEKHLLRERGWVEYSVYALFSPQSLIAEGSANYGIDMAFPGRERLAFERDVLFPLAGLDPAEAESYFEMRKALRELSHAGNEAARAYLDGEMDAEAAKAWLNRYALMSPERAAQRVRFIDTYRGYVINYNLGRDMVAAYIEERAPDGDDANRWAAFSDLLASPRLPADL